MMHLSAADEDVILLEEAIKLAAAEKKELEEKGKENYLPPSELGHVSVTNFWENLDVHLLHSKIMKTTRWIA